MSIANDIDAVKNARRQLELAEAVLRRRLLNGPSTNLPLSPQRAEEVLDQMRLRQASRARAQAVIRRQDLNG